MTILQNGFLLINKLAYTCTNIHLITYPSSSGLCLHNVSLIHVYCARYGVTTCIVQSWKAEWSSMDSVSFYISHVSLLYLSWAQLCYRPCWPSMAARVHRVWIFKNVNALLLRQTKEKTDDENKSNEPQSFVTQAIPG